MSRVNRGLIKGATLLVAGAAFGGGVSAAIAVMRASSDTASNRPPRKEAVNPDDRLQHLQRRIAQLEARPSVLPPAATAAADAVNLPASDEASADPLWSTPDERRERFWQGVEDSLAEHEAEPLDGPWATSTAGLFRQDLQKLEESQSFRLDSLDCRSRTCVARLSWRSVEQASAGWREVLHQTYSANCAKSVVLSDDVDPSGEQRALVYFDCTDWRDGRGQASQQDKRPG
jgi:hypothetical protein